MKSSQCTAGNNNRLHKSLLTLRISVVMMLISSIASAEIYSAKDTARGCPVSQLTKSFSYNVQSLSDDKLLQSSKIYDFNMKNSDFWTGIADSQYWPTFTQIESFVQTIDPKACATNFIHETQNYKIRMKSELGKYISKVFDFGSRILNSE